MLRYRSRRLGVITVVVAFGGIGIAIMCPPTDAVSGPNGGSDSLPAAALLAPPGTTERDSIAANGGQANAESGGASGAVVASRPSQVISGDGRWVAFVSSATNLIPGTTRPAGGLYVRDRQAGTTVAAPWLDGGAFPSGVVAAEPAISRDGGVVAFTIIVPGGSFRGIATSATTPYVLAWDRQPNTTSIVSLNAAGQPTAGWQPSISADGRYVAYTQWAPTPTATPTPAPTPSPTPDTVPPSITNFGITGAYYDSSTGHYFILPSGNSCSIPSAATISVSISDPSGLSGSVYLNFYEPNTTNLHKQAMALNLNDHLWRSTITAQSTWQSGFQIIYWIEATDTAGNRAIAYPDSGHLLYEGVCVV